jgi:hypothetical protein
MRTLVGELGQLVERPPRRGQKRTMVRFCDAWVGGDLHQHLRRARPERQIARELFERRTLSAAEIAGCCRQPLR